MCCCSFPDRDSAGGVTHCWGTMSQDFSLVIWDFDNTILGGLHTGGCVPLRDINKCCQAVTPAFRQMVSHLYASGVTLAVATFSDEKMARGEGFLAGASLVRRVLRSTIGEEIESHFLIAAAYPELHPWMPTQKQWHLRSLTELAAQRKCEAAGAPDSERARFRPARTDVVLFDDDEKNVRGASEEGYPAVWVDPRCGFTEEDWNKACGMRRRLADRDLAARQGSLSSHGGGGTPSRSGFLGEPTMIEQTPTPMGGAFRRVSGDGVASMSPSTPSDLTPWAGRSIHVPLDTLSSSENTQHRQ